MNENYEIVMSELALLGNERLKKNYLGQGAKEPLFGVATGAMKPLARKYKNNQELANELYGSGNYDAMYLAGMIADISRMTEANFDLWMEGAYFYMISDYIVAVTLAETAFAQRVADRYIETGEELYASAGYSCYAWLLGNRKDEEFDQNKIDSMLKVAADTIHHQPDRVKYAMNNFITAVGVSFLPSHDGAMTAANKVGTVEIEARGKPMALSAASEIQKAIHKNRLGFKRKNVRC